MKFHASTILLISAAFASLANAQNSNGSLDFDFMVETRANLTYSNPSSISAIDLKKIAMVDLSARKDNGQAISLSESPGSFEGKAYTEAFGKLNDALSYHGKLSYSYFQGRDMGSQILLDPLNSPVNFLENTMETTGTKMKELYSLLGALSYRFDDSWAVGFQIDYEAGDYTKVKDPRFSNIWMDLDVSLGTTYSPSQDFSFGLALRYRNTMEQIQGKIFGTTDKQYFIFCDRGGFFGTVSELAGDYNVISTSNFRPLSNTYLGGSLDATFGGKFFNQLSFYLREGYYGKKSSTTATFFENMGFVAGYDGTLLIPRGSNLHRSFISATFELMDNTENSFKYVTPVGQTTVVEYVGHNQVLDRMDISVSAGHKWARNADGYCPDLEIGGGVDFFSRIQTTTIYPVYRKYDYANVSAEIFGTRSLFSGKNIFSFNAAVMYMTGFGTPKNDGAYASATTSARSYDLCLNSQFEYDTASRAGAELGFRYTRLVSSNFAVYASLTDRLFLLLREPQYLSGRTRNVAAIAVGCNF